MGTKDFAYIGMITVGMFLTSSYGVSIEQRTGVTARELVPFVLGIWIVAWAPLFALSARVRKLSKTLDSPDQRRMPKDA